jgi:hypothetical protein
VLAALGGTLPSMPRHSPGSRPGRPLPTTSSSQNCPPSETAKPPQEPTLSTMLPSDHGASYIYNESPSRTSSQQHHQSMTIRRRYNHHQVTPSGVLFLSSIQPFLYKFTLSSVCLKLEFSISYMTAVDPPGLLWTSSFLNPLTISEERLKRVRETCNI